jgi:adenylyltransferase/sulfurtransferase
MGFRQGSKQAMSPLNSGADGFQVDERGLPPGYPLRPDWEITPREYVRRKAAGEKIIVVDVRPQSGREIACIPDTIHIPLQEIESRADEVVDADGSCVVTLCHHGVNSLRAAAVLRHAGVQNVLSMAGGIHLWSVDIDPSVPIY